MKKEIFKDIPEWEGLYKVSNLGNVISLYFGNERIVKQGIDNFGYSWVKISKNKFRKKYRIHQLVAMSFLDHKPNGHKSVIDHINSDKSDNRLENLRIITQRENSSKLGKHKKTSKYIGVSWNKNYQKWNSRISVNGKIKNLGYFDTEPEAAEAYQKALSELS